MIWNIFQWRSLKTRVTLLTLTIFLLGVWSLQFYANRALRADMQRQLGEQQFSMVSILAAYVNQDLADRLRALEVIAGEITPTLIYDTATLQTRLEQQSVFQRLFNGGAYVTGLDGVVIANIPVSTRRLGTNFLSDPNRGYLEEALKGNPTISRPFIGRILNAAVFPMAVPIRDTQGKVIGALAGVTDLGKPNFLDHIVQSKYGNSGIFLLIAPQHKLFVTATNKMHAMQPVPAPGINAFHDKVMHGYEGYGVTTNSSGVDELAAAKGIPVAGWVLAIAMPTSDAFAGIRDLQQRMLLATTLLTLLACGLIWWLMWSLLKRQLSPMIAATKQLDTLSRTNQTPSPLPVTSQDEVGELIGGFNRLLASLAKREGALRASESHLSFLVSASPVTIYTCAPVPPFRITYISPNVTDNFGHRPEQFTDDDQLWRESIHPEDRQQVFDDRSRVMEQGRCLCRFRLRAGDGGYRWIRDDSRAVRDAAGEAVAIVGSWTDITEPRQTALALEEASEKFRGLSEAALDAIFISENGVCLEQNGRAEEMFGYTAAEAKGLPATQWVVAADRERMAERTANAVELPYEVTGLRKDGSTFPALARGKTMHFRGRAVRVTSISDLTEQKRVSSALLERSAEVRALNERLSETQVQLMQSEKLASIGQLAAGVAHEINNPIGYVHSNMGSLEKYVVDLLAVLDAYESAVPLIVEGGARASLEQVKRDKDLDYLRQDLPTLLSESKEGVARVRKIVQDLKDFSRTDTTQAWERADLHRCLDSTLSVVWNELKYKAEVIKEYGELPEVECVPSQINQVLVNLLVNAAQAIQGPRGKITLRTGADDNAVWIEIADTGVGIPAEIRGRIFDPFFTTKPVGKGTGLGLSLAYGIVQKHRGRVEVASAVGAGTTFRVILPITQPVVTTAK